MNELTRTLATTQIDEWVDQAARRRVPGRPRPHGRHALAARLHQVAARLDA